MLSTRAQNSAPPSSASADGRPSSWREPSFAQSMQHGSSDDAAAAPEQRPLPDASHGSPAPGAPTPSEQHRRQQPEVSAAAEAGRGGESDDTARFRELARAQGASLPQQPQQGEAEAGNPWGDAPEADWAVDQARRRSSLLSESGASLSFAFRRRCLQHQML